MSLERAVRGGMMARAIREVLESYATPDRVQSLLSTALASAGLDAIPETAHEAAAFVNGPFRRTVTRLVGEDAADAAVESLRPVVEVASGFHPVPDGRPEPSAASAHAPGHSAPMQPLLELDADLELDLPALPEPVGTPVVLVATLDRGAVEVLTGRLRARAEVRAVADTFEWLASLEAFSGRRLVLVLDCCLPSVDPLDVGAMAAMLPPFTDVILWGAADDVLEQLYALVGAARNWHHLPADAAPPNLADFITTGL